MKYTETSEYMGAVFVTCCLAVVAIAVGNWPYRRVLTRFDDKLQGGHCCSFYTGR